MRDKLSLHEHGPYHLCLEGRIVTIIGLFPNSHPNFITFMDE